jgi:phosphonate metabolism protein PhnN/1,5-bisphosphokinase (PRPP-forming)
MSQRGDFCLEWHIYGLAYGVPANIREILDRGDHVLLNISRDVIPEARRKFARSRVVFVQVPFEVTLARIKSRGREAEDDPVFLERVERARQKQELPGADFVVDNSGPLEVGGQALMEYLRQEMLSSD